MAFKCALVSATRNFTTATIAFQEAKLSGLANRCIIKEPISKHLELFRCTDNSDILSGKNEENAKPLVVMLGWLKAKPQHLKKYSDIYTKRGYNVLTVSMSLWQFIWPTTGAHLIADELLHYLKMGPSSQPLILHGFSVGAYLWGECLVKMNFNLTEYSDLIKRIRGQVWDSAPDISELHKGLPMAIAPNNAVVRRAAEKYFSYHLKTFYDIATQHYLRSSQYFYTTPVKAPSLIFICKNDPIASYDSNKKVQEYWQSVGMKTYLKCWDRSKHVSHLALHKEEYLATLNYFLTSLYHNHDSSRSHHKIAAKL